MDDETGKIMITMLNSAIPATMLDGSIGAQLSWWMYGFFLGVVFSAIGSLIRVLRTLKHSSPEV